jgi:lipopolysaccharide assembly outer membrane protein LptD (OstA)
MLPTAMAILCALAVLGAAHAQPRGPALPTAAPAPPATAPAAAGAGVSPLWPSDEGLTIHSDSFEAGEGPGGRVAVFDGNVTLEQEGAKLAARHGLYRESRREFVLYGGVSGVDEGATVAADTLRYFRDTDLAVLVGRASYADTAATVSAGRIEFFRREDIAVCIGGAVVVDAERTSELHAERITYDFERSEARASGDPVLTTYTDDGEVDATLRADVVELARADSTLRAYGTVGIVRGDVRAGARAVTIFRDDDTMFLEGDPFVAQKTDQLSGERIFVSAPDGELSRVLVTGRALASYRIEPRDPGDEAERGTVAGDTLTMFFEEGDPVLTVVHGRAESEHTVGASGERNVVSARELTVLFSEGEIERAVFRGEAAGVYRFLPEEGGERAPVAPGPSAGPADTAAARPDTSALESVRYRAAQITYYVERNRIMLGSGATVEYKGTVLRADEVVFDPETEELSASGSPDFSDEGERIVGDTLAYDLNRRTGSIVDGATTFEDGLYYGDRIERDTDGSLRVRGGVYTTCSAAHPHYRLVSHQMRIYLDDKVVARPVILYIGDLPVLALPFYVFPIRKGRQSGFLIPQIEFGLSEGQGRFIRNFGYYWAPNDYWDVTAWADYYDQTRWIAHLQTRYALRYALSGSVETSFMEETLGGQRRWDLVLDHRQELGRNWTAGASGDFRSDATYASDANQSIQESLNRSLHSQLWVRGRWSGLTTGVTLDRREELDEGSVAELLPRVEMSGSQRPLVSVPDGTGGIRGWLGRVSYNWDARAVNDRKRADGATTVRQGVGLGLSLRTSSKLLGWLGVSPHASLTQNWYDRDKSGNRFPSRLTYGAGVSASTAIYGTFFPRIGPLEGVRHIIEPSATYAWTPDLAKYFREDGTDRFHAFSGFGSTPRASEALSVSLVNKVQLKVRDGADVRKLDSFLRLSVSSAYDLRADDDRWSDIVSRAELRPGDPLSVSWDVRHDPYTGRIGSSSITATVSLSGESPAGGELPAGAVAGEDESPLDELRRSVGQRSSADDPGRRPWDASVTFRYARGARREDETYWADGTAALSLTPGWRVNWNVHYDLRDREVASQEYVIHRDLHCWEAEFVRRYYAGEWEYYFRINVKALPDIQLETGSKSLNRSVR